MKIRKKFIRVAAVRLGSQEMSPRDPLLAGVLGRVTKRSGEHKGIGGWWFVRDDGAWLAFEGEGGGLWFIDKVAFEARGFRPVLMGGKKA